MKTINVRAIGTAGISAMVAIAARGQMDTTASTALHRTSSFTAKLEKRHRKWDSELLHG